MLLTQTFARLRSLSLLIGCLLLTPPAQAGSPVFRAGVPRMAAPNIVVGRLPSLTHFPSVIPNAQVFGFPTTSPVTFFRGAPFTAPISVTTASGKVTFVPNGTAPGTARVLAFPFGFSAPGLHCSFGSPCGFGSGYGIAYGYGGSYGMAGGYGGGSYAAPSVSPAPMTNPASVPMQTAAAANALNWPTGLRVLGPSPEVPGLRQEIETNFQMIGQAQSRQAAAALLEQTQHTIQKLRQRLDDSRGKMALGTITEAQRFLDSLDDTVKKWSN